MIQQGREPKRAIIFDFDGTIADSFQYVYDFLCREAGRAADEQAAAAMQYHGMSMKAMALKLGIPLWRLPFLYFRGRKVMREHLMDVQPFGGMPELIRALHSSGERLYIVSSNSARNIRNFLKTNELEGYFIGVRGGAGIFGKVSIIRQVLVRYRLAKTNCWYIGDEVGDMVAAKAVGIRAVAVTWGFASVETLSEVADAYARDVPELVELLK